jgi:predicted membrane-bound mannosyltransferase
MNENSRTPTDGPTISQAVPPVPPVPSVPPVPPAPFAPFAQAPAPAPAEPRKRSMAPWIVMVAVFALLIGAGIGFAASQPSKNDMKTQRDSAQAQVTQIQGQVTQLEGEVASQKDAAASATSARDECSKAAVDASDLIGQDRNLLQDISQLIGMTPGTPEEVALEQHMNTQAESMDAQSKVVTQELASCKAAVNG